MMTDSTRKRSPITNLGMPATVFLLFAFGNSHAALIAQQFDTMLPLAEQNGQTVARTIGTLLWLSGTWLLSRALDLLVLNPLIRSRTGQPAPRILSNMISATLLIASIFMILKFVYGRPVGGLLATSGIVTVVIGFAVRDMIADFFAGLAINIEQPYRIGDWLELGPGVVGA